MGNLNCKKSSVAAPPPRRPAETPSAAAVDPVERSKPQPRPQPTEGGVGDDGGIVEEAATVPSSIEGDDFAIPVRVYLRPPSAPRIRAAAFFVHGGVFAHGDRDSHPTIARGLANLGLAVVTASFRNGDEAPHETNITMRDLRDVVDYARGRWGELPFGLVGSSSVSPGWKLQFNWNEISSKCN